MTENEARELVRQGAMPILKRWDDSIPETYTCFVKELLEEDDESFIFHVAAAPEGTDPEKLCSYKESEDEDGPGEYYGGDPIGILKDTAEVVSGLKFY